MHEPDGSHVDVLQHAAARLPRVALAHLPTPLEPLPRLSAALGGPQILIKRDDCTGLAMGGNKTRHNEFLLADAIHKDADTVVWGAGIQSNNCRQTAAACARLGLRCHLVLGRGEQSEDPVPLQGNLLLDYLLGAVIHVVPEPIGPRLDDRIFEHAERLRADGHAVYHWDPERVKPLAAVSYVVAWLEMRQQWQSLGIAPAAVYVSSSGSTGAGMALAARFLDDAIPVHSISPIHWPYDTAEEMAHIANDAAKLLELPTRLRRADIHLNEDFIAPGYGKLNDEAAEAIELFARREGILLDPVYTGKAAAAMIHDIRAGEYERDQTVVFVHTGGTPALFAYAEPLQQWIRPAQ